MKKKAQSCQNKEIFIPTGTFSFLDRKRIGEDASYVIFEIYTKFPI